MEIEAGRASQTCDLKLVTELLKINDLSKETDSVSM